MDMVEHAVGRSPRFSIVVAFRGVVDHLDRLLLSISKQNRRDVEVVVVCHESDYGAVELVNSYKDTLDIVLIKAHDRGQTTWRNLGLSAASGEIITFPDDDCWYPEEVLNSIDKWFWKTDPHYTVLIVGIQEDVSAAHPLSSGSPAHDVSPWDMMRAGLNSRLFTYRRDTLPILDSDRATPRLDGAEFLLGLLSLNVQGHVDLSIRICQPRLWQADEQSARHVIREHAEGEAALLKRYSLRATWVGFILIELAYTLLLKVAGRSVPSSYSWTRTKALLAGFRRRDALQARRG